MYKILENVPETDPIKIPAQKKIIDGIISANEKLPGATMVILNDLQNKIGFISEPMQAYVAQQMDIPVSVIHGVVTFYSFFTTQPRGKHTVKFCMGTACYVGGTEQLIEKAKQILGIEVGQTTKDGMITMEICRCVGACSQAPVIVIDEQSFGRVKPNKVPQMLKPYQGS
jgi:NADH-quinone oxidoreductase subunit E